MKPSEELNKGYEFTKAQIAELESLRAENVSLKLEQSMRKMAEQSNAKLLARLAELEKQEPVGEIVRTETSHGCDRTAISWLKYPYAKYGAKLYLSPVVSPDVEKVKAEIISLRQQLSAAQSNVKERDEYIRALKTELEEQLTDDRGLFIRIESELSGVKYSGHYDAGIRAIKQQLAESKAREARLRETLFSLVVEGKSNSFEAQEALALPHDGTSLREYRDAVIDGLANKLKSVTEYDLGIRIEFAGWIRNQKANQ